jgi:hypothetical protein
LKAAIAQKLLGNILKEAKERKRKIIRQGKIS